VTAGGRPVGIVTSGCLSPTLGHGIAMGFVEIGASEPGMALGVDTGRGVLEGKVAKLPFYKAPKPS
jgi:aminomethyltransferase